jgi:hypothetical protein
MPNGGLVAAARTAGMGSRLAAVKRRAFSLIPLPADRETRDQAACFRHPALRTLRANALFSVRERGELLEFQLARIAKILVKRHRFILTDIG